MKKCFFSEKLVFLTDKDKIAIITFEDSICKPFGDFKIENWEEIEKKIENCELLHMDIKVELYTLSGRMLDDDYIGNCIFENKRETLFDDVYRTLEDLWDIRKKIN